MHNLHVVGKVASVMQLRCMAHRDILLASRVWLSYFYRMSRIDSISRNHPYTILGYTVVDITPEACFPPGRALQGSDFLEQLLIEPRDLHALPHQRLALAHELLNLHRRVHDLDDRRHRNE